MKVMAAYYIFCSALKVLRLFSALRVAFVSTVSETFFLIQGWFRAASAEIRRFYSYSSIFFIRSSASFEMFFHSGPVNVYFPDLTLLTISLSSFPSKGGLPLSKM